MIVIEPHKTIILVPKSNLIENNYQSGTKLKSFKLKGHPTIKQTSSRDFAKLLLLKRQKFMIFEQHF